MTDTRHGTATTELVPTTLPGLGPTYLDQSMVPKVNAFIANAQAHGVDLHFNSAFRTPEGQERLHHDPNAITPADHSLHSAGFAVRKPGSECTLNCAVPVEIRLRRRFRNGASIG